MEDKCSKKVGHSWKGIAFPQGRLHPRKYRVSSFSKGKKLFSSWLIIPCLSSMFPAAKRLWAQLSILTPDTMKPSFLKWWSRVKFACFIRRTKKNEGYFPFKGVSTYLPPLSTFFKFLELSVHWIFLFFCITCSFRLKYSITLTKNARSNIKPLQVLLRGRCCAIVLFYHKNFYLWWSKVAVLYWKLCAVCRCKISVSSLMCSLHTYIYYSCTDIFMCL